jgi:hypothetical protein
VDAYARTLIFPSLKRIISRMAGPD